MAERKATEETNTSGYYAVIPASVRYDDRLPGKAALLYGEITALCGAEGYCWASNAYFAKLYHVQPPTIRAPISTISSSVFAKCAASIS